MNGDILIEVDISEGVKFHKTRRGIDTVALKPYSFPVKYGIINVSEEDLIMEWREKPSIQLTMKIGLYVLEPNSTVISILNQSK